jgi:hypothetical protein
MKTLILLSTVFLFGCSGQSQKLAGNNSYPIVIAFHSICCGVPSDEPIKEYVLGFKKEHKIDSIKYVRIAPLGKEGEFRLAFPLAELNMNQRKIFIEGMMKIEKRKDDPGTLEFLTDVQVNKAEFPERVKFTELSY